ncbi:MAG: SAM-dependent methyltransferase [Candidatus Paceibacteria bacterium]|jgi:SAM-dependent methyltransferase
MSKENTKLNIGCAGYKKEGYINLDWQSIVVPDVNHDLNSFPYPFEDNQFELIEASHILEHLDRPFSVMTELHRILKPGGKLLIRVPHFSRGMTHPEHSHGFDVTFPNYFDRRFEKIGFYGVEFEHVSTLLQWHAFPHIAKEMGVGVISRSIVSVCNSVFNSLAKLSPFFCSRVWCFWVGGFEEIRFELVCKK